jgi:signal peptidase I
MNAPTRATSHVRTGFDWLVFARLLAINFALALCCKAIAQAPVAPFVTYVAHTGSMRPTLKGGELVAVGPARIEEVKVGDVVVWRWEATKKNVIHRVIAIRRTRDGIGLVTKGDANLERDRVIVTADILVGVADLRSLPRVAAR